MSYLDQREYDTIEERIMEAEHRKDLLEKTVNDPDIGSDPEKLQKNWAELEAARERVDSLYLRWDELEEKKAKGF